MNEDRGDNQTDYSRLKAELDRLRDILDSTSDAVASYDRSFRFTSVNRQVEISCEKSRSELLGRVVWDVFPYIVDSPVYPNLVQAMETREPVHFEWLSAPHARWTEVRVYPTTDGITVYYRDITHRKRVEAELRASEDLNRRIVDAAPAGVVHVGIDGSITFANGLAQKLLGLAFDELTQRYLQDFAGEVLWEDGSPCPVGDYPVTKCLQTGEPQPAITLGVRRPDDGITWAVFTAVPLRDPLTDALSGSVVTFLDITERVRAEATRQILEQQLRHSQKMEAIGRLAGGIAHDFNNLLTVIQGYSSMLSRDVGSREEIDAIEDAAQRASSLTRKLLAFSRGQDSKPVLVDLNRIVRDLSAILRRLIGENVELVIDLEPGIGEILIDPDEIEQTIANLAVNARDAMPDGGTMTIRTTAIGAVEESQPDSVLLTVTDTGVGMNRETLMHSFEPFFTTKPVGKGTGLGLAVVYGIVTRAGGRIDIESESGRGTTFSVYLPRATSGSKAPDTNHAQESPSGSETVLVVEDEAMVRKITCDSLTRAGYNVLEAGDGERGLAVLAECDSPVHAVVTDIVMPRMSGTQMASLMASRTPDTRVLFMSGYAQGDLFRSELAVGRSAFLPKPFSPNALLMALRGLLDA